MESSGRRDVHVAGAAAGVRRERASDSRDRKSTRLNSSSGYISYAVFCLKKKKKTELRVPNASAHDVDRFLPIQYHAELRMLVWLLERLSTTRDRQERSLIEQHLPREMVR